jgi:hypothetical protein
MEYPLIGQELLTPLRLTHGLFNISVMLMFFYTARLGLRIRGARKREEARPAVAVRRHRKLGPILALLGGIGFGAGIALVLVDTGDILKYPAHLAVGTAIVILLTITYLVSRKITSPEASPYRQAHFLLGLTILALYLVQTVLGLGVLL